jgi:hypothetical protein
MQYAARMGDEAMDGGVNAPSRRVDPPCLGLGGGGLGIEEEQVACPQTGEMAGEGVDQKLLAVVRDGETEVIGDAFVKSKPRGPAKGGGKLAPLTGVIERFAVLDNLQSGSGHGQAPLRG